MNAIALLFVIGLIFLGVEVFIPGGILGALGGVALLGGCGLAFSEFGFSGGVVATLIALVLVGAMLYFEFVLVPKTAMGKRLFLKSAVTGTSAASRTKDYVGSEGITATALAPSGYVIIDGQRQEAFSRSGFLEANLPITVVGADNFRLIVTLKK